MEPSSLDQCCAWNSTNAAGGLEEEEPSVVYKRSRINNFRKNAQDEAPSSNQVSQKPGSAGPPAELVQLHTVSAVV